MTHKLIKVTKPMFNNQVKRLDVLMNMINRYSYEQILTNFGEKSGDKSYHGFVYETICIILSICKCLKISFSQILIGKFEEYHTQQELTNIKTILNHSIYQGNDKADITFKTKENYKIPVSIKYRDNESADSEKLNISTLKHSCMDNDKIGLIVKDKKRILDHNYKTKASKSLELITEINKNGLLFDEIDIKDGFLRFRDNFKHMYRYPPNECIEYINTNYMNNSRIVLVEKLHQNMFRNKIINNLKNGNLCHLIQNKPRSGKSILMLLISLDILNILKKKRILIMTSVPSTIKSFIDDLDKWDVFKNINYTLQSNFLKLNNNFEGICFTSVQYLKNDDTGIKKKQLKKLNFDACIFDESDFGSSTEKTLQDILHFTKNIKNEFKINIFASGTARKTRTFYNIPSECVYNWDIEDECLMKTMPSEYCDNFKIMTERHGETFMEYFSKPHIDKDYSNCPSQILIQPSILNNMIKSIESYNIKYNTDFGYSISSLLSLKQSKSNKNGINFVEQFQLSDTDDGNEFLSTLLQKIISNDANDNNTIEKYIEKIQSKHMSRKTSKKDPKIIIVYLPTGNRKGEIDKLQKTFIKFLNDNELWSKYNLSYTNSNTSSSDSKCEFNDFINNELEITKKNNKKGCILFLGRQGGRGITYNKCDVTISLDDGHNLDEQKQKNYRALTPSPDKTIGINVDLNIQRTYYMLLDTIRKFQNNNSKSYSEILTYLTEQKIFIFNPQEFNFGNIITNEIVSYYKYIAGKLTTDIKQEILLNNIECEDVFNNILNISTTGQSNIKINTKLEGVQKECIKPGEKRSLVSKESHTNTKTTTSVTDSQITNEMEEIITVNKTKELLKKLLPLLCIIMRASNQFDIYKRLFQIDKYINIINNNIVNSINKNSLSEIDLNNVKEELYKQMLSLEEQNNIVTHLIEIYRNSTPDEYRELIANHFIPTLEEKKNNAEIPTPVKTVDKMLMTLILIDSDIWSKKIKVLEPCCGKGNFILGIFDCIYRSNEHRYSDKSELCRIIISEYLYFCDLEYNNVFITEELLRIHAESYSNSKLDDLTFNSYVGDTLKLDIENEWGLDKFDIIIGNPPYQKKNKDGKSKHGKSNLWCDFIKYALNNLKSNGLLLFITPTSWMNGTVNCFNYMIENQIHYLNINECRKDFVGVGSQFSYYLIEKTPIYKDTIVVCEYKDKLFENNIQLNKNLKILPLMLTPDILNIINKLFNYENTDKFVRKDNIKSMATDCKKEKDDTFKYPVITFKKKTGELDIRYCKYYINNKDLKKVLLFRNGYLNPTYDNGLNSVGNNIHYCNVETEEIGYKLVELYNSSIYKFIFDICKYSGFNNGRVMNWLYNTSLDDVKKCLTKTELMVITDYSN